MREPIRKITLKDGSVRYVLAVDVGRRADGRRDQRTSHHKTLKEARTRLSAIRTEIDRGTYIRSTRETVNDHLDSWLESKRLAGKRPTTLRAYADILKPVQARFGTVPLQEFTADNVEAVKAAMLDGSARRIGVKGKPMSARSVNFMLGTLQQALDQAVKRRKVATNVAAMVERVASDTKPGAAWTVAESNAFKAVASRDRLHAAWLLTCYGLRRGEVLGLRWARDVNLTEGTVTIRVSRTLVAYAIVEGPPKTRRGERTLPLDETLIEALKGPCASVGTGAARRGSGV